MNSLPRMRSLPEAAKELKEYDPHTSFTEPVLRRMVREGNIPHVKSGRRILINLNSLEECIFLTKEDKTSKATGHSTFRINSFV